MAFSFVKGSDVQINIQVLSDAKLKTPFNLIGFTGATGYFPKTDDTFMPKLGELVSSDCGKIRFPLSDADTLLLKEGSISFQVNIDQGPVQTVVRFDDSVEVVPQLF